jgi:hypothetical protein
VNDEYLWNKTGSDREVEALEELLAPLRHGSREPAPPARGPRRVWIRALAVVAAAACIALVVRWWIPAAEPAATQPGTTAAREIDLKQYGTVDVHPGAVVEIVRQTDEDIRLRLERGTIEARITLAARPRLFQVETPATTCVDLGCRYTLTVEPDGSTFVHVELGQVAFVDGGRETWIPRDASCRAWPARGSGTPRWDDASPALAAAIESLDRSEPGARRAAAQQVIALCNSPRDALPLWHLAHEGEREVAEAAWSALVGLVGAPEGVEDPRSASAADAWKLHLEAVWEASGAGR